MAEKNKTTENELVSQSDENTMKKVQTAPVKTKIEFDFKEQKGKSEKND